MTHLCSVFLLSAPYTPLTYAFPSYLPETVWKIGQRVLVPVGNSVRVAIIQGVQTEEPAGVRIRPVLWPIEHVPFFSENYLDFIHDLSVRQMDAPGKILARMLPRGLRSAPVFQDQQKQRVSVSQLRAATPETHAAWASQWDAGLFIAIPPKPGREILYSLTTDPPWPVRPHACAQLEVLRFLDLHGVCSMATISRELGTKSSAVLRALVARGLVREVESLVHEPALCAQPGHELTKAQHEAVEACTQRMHSETGESALLFGVTGSGKTAVYLELIRRCIQAGRHAMVLAPEVALALKLHADVHGALPDIPTLCYHGYLTPAKKHQLFHDAAFLDRPHILVGTRSCLFLPVEPGLVILDEEHDASFKQDEGIIYQAREVAYGRIARSKGLLLMGSATPDIKVYHAAQTGALALTVLPERVGTARLPDVELVDLRTSPLTHGPFSQPVHDAIVHTVAQGDQVIILHNRRGYAPVMYCEACEEPAKCPHCSVALTLHKRREHLVCHYCGYSIPFPALCSQCKANVFLPLGAGTERVEEFLGLDLPAETRVLRLDRDTSRRAGAMEDILDRFTRHQADILIGTQMLSKGHHFPHVTLVVVVDGDLGLNLPDYRATERCFQMLVQVAGRAGRGDRPGRVFIQTRNPGHYCWEFIRTNNYPGFFEKEIEFRRVMGYPPFVKLALVRLSCPVEQDDEVIYHELGRQARGLGQHLGVRVLGPAPAPLPVLRGKKRFQCLLKADSWPAIRGVCAELRKRVTQVKNIRMSVDLDPVDML